MVNIAFLPAADADYQEALAWYQARSPQAAAGFEAAVEVALRSIGDAPERWTSCDDRHRFYILWRYPYSIIYRVEAGGVLVVAVAHASRSASYWQGRG
ncbi:MAG TPA: type II toxin-antitoxin system RelE/ParE family toxin [Isosphaeraceae bacterium]